MATSVLGQVEQFELGSDDWVLYTERLDQFFLANEITNDTKKVAVLLTAIGPKAYSLLRNLLAPVKPATKEYEELTDVRKDHLRPKPVVIAERFKFHRRNQGDEETVAQYMAELRKLAEHCDFKDYLNEAFRPRSVPYALREVIEKDLERLELLGVIEKVNHSDWAAPIVPVPKADHSVRLCGDYKVTINPMLQVDQFPLPKPEDLFATLAGGEKFTKLDLSHAYQQVLLEPESRKYVTINTHKGLYQYNRLPFGVASAPAVFQQTMVFDHLHSYGVRLKKKKCFFMQPSVEYLGYLVDAEGLHATPQKVDAIVNAPRPKNTQELRSVLGLANYYGKFIRNLAEITHPLNTLLRKNTRWKWSQECEQSFQKLKQRLGSTEVLVHYDAKLPLKLECDASSYGVGAVISHVLPDGSERPIAYASRTMTQSEMNYSQIEKEALALIVGVKNFTNICTGGSSP